jgi:hypothetical protein
MQAKEKPRRGYIATNKKTAIRFASKLDQIDPTRFQKRPEEKQKDYRFLLLFLGIDSPRYQKLRRQLAQKNLRSLSSPTPDSTSQELPDIVHLS